MASEWEKVAENLVRHIPSGGLYLRAKVGGKIIRKSLGTKAVKIGKMKRDDLLLQIRTAAGRGGGQGELTRDGLLELALAYYRALPTYQTKPASMRYRVTLVDVLKRTLPETSPAKWKPADVLKWWGSPEVICYEANRRNNMLGTLRMGISQAIENGLILFDPTVSLKRAPVRRKEVEIPTRDDFQKLVADIEAQGKAKSKEAANFVRFMAFCGCRPGEAVEVLWSEIGKNHITISGGEEGTKNHLVRRVPIIPAMKELLDSIRYDGAAGNVFSMKPPKDAINNACERLGFPNFTPKTFRHVFGTTCLESGVPLATVADWMGHKDKGKTLAAVYAHIREEHGIEEAKKVSFD